MQRTSPCSSWCARTRPLPTLTSRTSSIDPLWPRPVRNPDEPLPCRFRLCAVEHAHAATPTRQVASAVSTRAQHTQAGAPAHQGRLPAMRRVSVLFTNSETPQNLRSRKKAGSVVAARLDRGSEDPSRLCVPQSRHRRVHTHTHAVDPIEYVYPSISIYPSILPKTSHLCVLASLVCPPSLSSLSLSLPGGSLATTLRYS